MFAKYCEQRQDVVLCESPDLFRPCYRMGETFTLRMACCAAAGATIHIIFQHLSNCSRLEQEEWRMDAVAILKLIPSVHVGSL